MESYMERMTEKLNALRENGGLILSFESSCDETAVAVTRGRQVLASVISSQIEIHKRFGGVVPEIASRNHVLAIEPLTKDCLEQAGVTLEDVSAVAVTYGPGLLGALLVGVSYAKALAYALDVPLIAVDHMKGHMAANFISAPDLYDPFLCLLTSGGHTELWRVKDLFDVEVLGQTRDDAVGEAFDKVARVIGLPYPGGPQIEKKAKEGKPVYPLPVPFKGEKHLDFSFSGIKTAVINLAANAKSRGQELDACGLACSFQTTAVGILVDRAMEAVKRTGIKTLALAGGVGANGYLREQLTLACQKRGVKLYLPPKELCTDNAAMIGVAAWEYVRLGAKPAEITLDADPNPEE